MTELEYFARSTVIHEAGHIVVLEALGGSGHIRVGIREDASPNDRPFYGQCHLCLMPDDEGGHRLVGLAGQIAEYLDHDPELSELDAECHLEELEEISHSDMELAGDYTLVDIQRTIDLLRQHWARVEEKAQWYMGYLLEEAA